LNENGTINYARSITIIIFSPMQEELVFRGILNYLLRRRIPDTWHCMLLSNIIFGLFHLTNIFGNYSLFYVILQIALGFLLGLFYNCQLYIGYSIWEPVILHTINNLSSSLLSTREELDWTHPLVIFPLIQTFLVYGMLLWYSKKHMRL